MYRLYKIFGSPMHGASTEKVNCAEKFPIEFETKENTMQLKFPQIGEILENSHINEFALSFIYEKGNIILRNSQAWRDYIKSLKAASYEK